MTEDQFADRVAELVKELTGAEETTGCHFDVGTQVGVAVKWADYPKRHAKRELVGWVPVYDETSAQQTARVLADYFNGWHARVMANA